MATVVGSIDAETLQQLINAHGAALKLYARQWCQAPEDAVQEALIDLLRRIPLPDHPVPWLYHTVRCKAINLARAETRRSKHQKQAGQKREPWFLPQPGEPDHLQDVDSLLARLPRLEREILVARLWGEQSFAEIASLVGHPTSTVHRRYHQALRQLKQWINQSQTDETGR